MSCRIGWATMSEVEHAQKVIEQWPDGSKITVDRWRYDGIGKWIYGKYEIHCGTCGKKVGEYESEIAAILKYLVHATADMQQALMELSYRIGRGRMDGS